MKCPTYSKYVAPTNFTAVNAVADAARMAESPRDAAAMCTNVPAAMLSTATAPARQPWLELRLTMYKVSGPGVRLSRRPETTNNQRSCVPNTHLPFFAIAAPNRSRLDCGQISAGL